MMHRNGTVPGGGRAMPTTIKPSIKKKPPPPRPPQPSVNRLQTSVSFNTAQELGSKAGKDLIDFKTPPGSPNSGRRNTVASLSNTVRDPNEYSYRVGASIFYIKSPLKNSISHKAPTQNPFSPPRPSADSQQKSIITATSNLNAAWNSPQHSSTSAYPTSWDTPPASNTNGFHAKPAAAPVAAAASSSSSVISKFQNSSSLDNNNTIKSSYQTPSPWSPVGASSSSNASSCDRTSAAFNDFGSQPAQPRYGNVSEFKKELSATLSGASGVSRKPTIIRPVSKVQSNVDRSSTASAVAAAAVQSTLKNADPYGELDQKNYYDVPPDEDDDFDDSDAMNDSSFVSPPMPSEPPPPPPPDVLAVDEWVNSTTGVADYPDTYSDSAQVTAYAIALYDFQPEAVGDLQLQAGDLVYLLRRVDDSWYQGSCGGMEGMFPTNFVNVVVPLPDETAGNVQTQQSDDGVFTDALYDFSPETDGDLGLQAGEKIKVLGRINEDWLYGEKNGTKGQFPAAFVQQIFQDLPVIQI